MTTSPEPERTREQYLVEALSGTAFDAPTGAQEATSPVWLVDGMMLRGSLLMLAGPPKTAGKSLLALDLCYRVASGTPFLGRAVRRGRAFLANLEDGAERLKWRLRDFGIRPDVTCPPNSFTVMPDKDKLASWLEFFCDYSNDPPDLIVIDPTIYAEIALGVTDENNPREITSFCDKLRTITKQGRTTIVLVHHFRKAGDTLRGSSAWEASVDGWLNFVPGSGGLRHLSWCLRDGEPGEAGVALKYENGAASVAAVDPALSRPTKGSGSKKEDDPAKWTDSELKTRVWQVINQAKRNGDEKGPTTTDIRKLLKAKNAGVVTALQDLLDEGLISRQKGPRGGWTPAVMVSDEPESD